jgi:DUF4097 and DUF4098 domain-containing protein YvlB
VIVTVKTSGRDASRIRVRIAECDGARELLVVYPSTEILDRTYEKGSRSSTTLQECGRSRRYEFSSWRGLDARAEITVEVPRDQRLHAQIGSGTIEASKVHADLTLDNGTGRITVRDAVGSLHLESGSGEVVVEGAKGEVYANCGSGGITVRDVDGSLSVDAGSGGVSVERLRASEVSLECGSGGIEGGDIVAGKLHVECGSGSIDITGLNAPRATIESGSGGVSVALARSPESLRIESGSGGVTFLAPKNLDATFDIECAKQLLDVDVPMRIESQDRSTTRGRVGKGTGTIEIGTGSGRVAIRSSDG